MQVSPQITEIVWVRDNEDLTYEDGSENGEAQEERGLQIRGIQPSI